MADSKDENIRFWLAPTKQKRMYFSQKWKMHENDIQNSAFCLIEILKRQNFCRRGRDDQRQASALNRLKYTECLALLWTTIAGGDE